MTELQKRLIVAAIGIPTAILIIFTGSFLFAISVIAASSVALNEFYNIASKKDIQPDKIPGIIMGAVLQIVLYLSVVGIISPVSMIVVSFLFVFVVLLRQLFSKKRPHPIVNIAATVGGVMYISLFFGSLILLREFASFASTFGLANHLNKMAEGSVWAWIVTSMMASVWACDSAAYFIGKAIGKHKLFVSISPKKTWEGAIAGLIGAVLVFMTAAHFFFAEVGWANALVIGIIIGISGQIGDLAESQLKRDAGVKDSSALFPGHGGMLDRFDSIIFVSPLTLSYLIIIFML